MSLSLKKKARVSFRARKDSGNGVITNIIESLRGLWYEVKGDNGKTYKLRAAHITVI